MDTVTNLLQTLGAAWPVAAATAGLAGLAGLAARHTAVMAPRPGDRDDLTR